MNKRIINCMLAVVLCFAIVGCGKEETKNADKKIKNTIQPENENVLAVKGGHPNAYPDKTYGEAFEDFFGSPTWEYFVGTMEGPDDDGDGKPDYTEENIDIVEFTGDCTYENVEVKVLLQFTLDKGSDNFSATYLSINDVPQDDLTLISLLETVFTDGEEEEAAAEPSEQTNAEDNGQANLVSQAMSYVGEWQDMESQRCNMTIDLVDGETYFIDINWGSSAWDNTHWSFAGTFDTETGAIVYSGSRIEEYYTEQGDTQETYVYTDGEGQLFIGDDGMLYWDDYKEDAGDGCVFVKN